MPFMPSGDRARWRVLYDLLREARVGELVTYQDMAEALDVHPDDQRSTIQLAMRRAARELETEDKRAVEAVVNAGYRVVEPREHLVLAQQQQRRAGKALERGQSKVVNVDLTGLAPEVRHAFEVTARAFALQAEFNRRLSVRQENLERAVEAVTTQSAESRQRTEQELSELRERLRRLEEKASGSE